MTKTITLPSGEYMLVKVPDYHADLCLTTENKKWSLICFPYGKQPLRYETSIPYDRDCSILGLASQITEEVAAGIVDIVFDTPRLYADNERPQGITYAPIT